MLALGARPRLPVIAAGALFTLFLGFGWYIFHINEQSSTPAMVKNNQRDLSEISRLDAMFQESKKQLPATNWVSDRQLKSSQEKNLANLARLDMSGHAYKDSK